MKAWQIALKIAAAALAVCAAFYLVLKYWDEISDFFGQLRDKIVLRCACSSDRSEDEFAEVDE
jgi:hypothetical protein